MRRQEKKQRDQEALVISQDVTKILKVTDILISEQDEQDLSQSYEASSESIRSASYVLSKQPQVNASKLTCNLENREDSSRSESCDMEELKSDLHDEVIAKLDKNIIVEQELKQQFIVTCTYIYIRSNFRRTGSIFRYHTKYSLHGQES